MATNDDASLYQGELASTRSDCNRTQESGSMAQYYEDGSYVGGYPPSLSSYVYNPSSYYPSPSYSNCAPPTPYYNYYGTGLSDNHYQMQARSNTPRVANSRIYHPSGGSSSSLSRSYRNYPYSSSYGRLDAFLKPRPPASQDIVPKFYKSVIEDVVGNIREIFLDDGVDEQIIHELRTVWERKISESHAIDHAVQPGAETSSTAGRANSKSSAASAAAKKKQQQQQHQHQLQSQAQHPNQQIGQTSVITSNPNHIKNGSSSGDNQVVTSIVKSEIGDDDGEQLNMAAAANNPVMQRASAIVANSSATSSVAIAPAGTIVNNGLQQQSINMNPGAKSYAMINGVTYVVNTPNGVMPLTSEMLSQLNPIIANSAQPIIQHGLAPALGSTGTIQFARTMVPQVRAMTSLQSQANQPTSSSSTRVAQLDGMNDSSDDDEDEEDYQDNDEDQDDDDNDINDEDNDGNIEDEEPLNSGDDVSDEDPSELFETDNVVVCQYDKVTRCRNKWKFHFKDGIMNLQGKDYVFQKAIGDAEW